MSWLRAGSRSPGTIPSGHDLVTYDGLLDEPYSGAHRTVDYEAVEYVVTAMLESMPRETTHWSTRSMMAPCVLGSASVGRIWRAFGLPPAPGGNLKSIVSLYLSPLEQTVVLSIDEKSQIQAMNRNRTIIPMRPGIPEH